MEKKCEKILPEVFEKTREIDALLEDIDRVQQKLESPPLNKPVLSKKEGKLFDEVVAKKKALVSEKDEKEEELYVSAKKLRHCVLLGKIEGK